MSVAVSTWLRPIIADSIGNLDSLFAASVRPAIRAWGDALIFLRVRQEKVVKTPPIAIRTNALFARLIDMPSPSCANSYVRVGLHVDPSKCALARQDFVDLLYFWPTWAELKEHLVDRGHNADRLAEAVSPLNHTEAFMMVDHSRALSYIESMSTELREDILSYFAPSIDSYLETWHIMTDSDFSYPRPGAWEVIIPRARLISATRHE